MIKKRYLLVAILVLLMVVGVGCGQEQATKSKTTNTKTERQEKKSPTKKTTKKNTKKTMLIDLKDSKKDKLVYYALGDSLSVGLFSNNQNSRFTTLFKDKLQQGTGKNVTEINNSSVGKTVTNFGLPNVQSLIDQNPDIVTIEFGTNDSAYGIDSKNLGDFTNNLDTLVQKVQSQTKAKILLMTTWSPSDGQYIDNDAVYDRKIKEIGQKYNIPVIDLATIWRNNPKVTENDLNYSQVYNRTKDNFHPNQLGHDKIAQLLYQTVKTK
ncbi:SGNH/GDSL hydrolase family protein [Companilactobacillus halodurans]|uniref:SGNH/GDSL hydrolase family protein n=1 Tax=Companilactobacillus halodurans TaxID=2584183 RepID=A0A5P0ZWG2_9LACO|nr:SGNH/GDSL hydrolase family protein [Companilactobacillus halodurans]MQS76231.1 SGNH/GDSL hydrolase family protein [Companilactobacillus halodurans]MQS97371.1 SGNH/GDSL hydrolase family protein [Companilactobacillus halodurans]